VREYAVAEGRFLTDEDAERSNKVAVLGSGIAQELFGDGDPVRQSIKVGSTKLTVVGVMEEKGMVGSTDYDSRVYIPITVVFDKFSDNMMETAPTTRDRQSPGQLCERALGSSAPPAGQARSLPA
jgi:hypothetical protein